MCEEQNELACLHCESLHLGVNIHSTLFFIHLYKRSDWLG